MAGLLERKISTKDDDFKAEVDRAKAEEARQRRLQTLNEAAEFQVQRAISNNGQKAQKSMYPILELTRSAEPESIHEAAERGMNLMIDKFLRDGSTVDAKDKLGRTPIFWAIENGHLHTVDFLIQRGAVLSIVESSTGRNILHMAARSGQTEIMQLLFDTMSAYVKSKLLNQPDLKGITPVYLAYTMGPQTEKCFELLLQAGATFESLSTGAAKPVPTIATLNGIGGAVDLNAIKEQLIRGASGMSPSVSESGVGGSNLAGDAADQIRTLSITGSGVEELTTAAGEEEEARTEEASETGEPQVEYAS